MDQQNQKLIRMIRNPFKFKWYLFTRLPSAFFSGIMIKEVNLQHCTVSIRYRWFTRNPFRSTYFACLSMAAEMSTGALAMLHAYSRKPSVSMIVTRVESSYFKKATTITYFTCNDGIKLNEAIENAMRSEESFTCEAYSEGKNETGELVASFVITWSFKARTTRR